MGKIFITRHGETEYNLKRLMQGVIDTKLSDKGLEQAEMLRDRLKDVSFDRVLVSPLRRARVTAETILKDRCETMEFFDELMEMDFGIMQGRDYDFLEKEYPDLHREFEERPAGFTIPEGDSFQGFHDRVMKIVEEIESVGESENMLIVSHGITKLVIVNELKGIPLERLWDTDVAGNTAVTMFEKTSDGFILHYENDQSHLKERAAWSMR
jgi:probable phosphoglycerate mutase